MTAPGGPLNGREPTTIPAHGSFDRRRYTWEVCLVLAVTVGQSAIYSVLTLIRRLLTPVPLGQQQAQVNPSRDVQAFWDILYQLLAVFFALALVGLVIYLLWEPGTNALRRIGLDFTRFGGDLGRGILLAAWWTVPLLVLSAIRAGLTEEVIFIAYLFDRLRRLGWNWWAIILSTAALRGAYHAYQGIGAIVGNFVMGVVFGWCYKRWGRVMPLVIAHTLLDVVAFVGYPLAAALWPGIFGPTPGPTPTPTGTPTPTPTV